MENSEMILQIAELIEQSENRTANRLQQINIKIENDVSKKLESLFDGYKLTHEKQWELERKIENLERRLEALENITA